MKVHNKANLLTVTTQHIRLPGCHATASGAKWSSFLHSTASSFRLVEPRVLWGEWMNGGFMEMRKCNGTLFSILVAGTVALCIFCQGHERRTISLSAINNMVSFEADYPSVEVEENKRLKDNGWSWQPRFLLPWEKPMFCFVLFKKSNLQSAHSLRRRETLHTYFSSINAKFNAPQGHQQLKALSFVLNMNES